MMHREWVNEQADLVSPKTGHCQLLVSHSPHPLITVNHHIVAESWGGATVASNLFELCYNCHMNVHEIIDAIVLHRPDPSSASKASALARRGIAEALAAGLTPVPTM